MVWAVSLDTKGTATNGLTGATDPFVGDDGSNGGSGDTYIGPDLWTNDTQAVGCESAPCTLILPPYPLATPTTLTWPDYVTTLMSSSAGAIYTKTTTVAIDPFVISEIPFWAVTVADPQTVGTAYLSLMQSITPPSVILTVASTELPFPVVSTDYSASLIASATATASTSAVSTPAAVQSGIASDCIEFYHTIAGDSCYSIAQAYDITQAQFLVSNLHIVCLDVFRFIDLFLQRHGTLRFSLTAVVFGLRNIIVSPLTICLLLLFSN